ncbi:hypothetical protein [Nocardioides litoris]|uniref:hypothetical protein n=1 Tax=Nocardioides litoris TaxID=1926648 RepID=UPI00147777BE|nr:hypothetical protein [Nocardioides litoris]
MDGELTVTTKQLRVAQRDRDVLHLLADLGACTYSQLGHLVGASHDALRQRLPRLATAGLLTSGKTYRGSQRLRVWQPTTAGLRRVDRVLSATLVDAAAVHAAVDRVELAISLAPAEARFAGRVAATGLLRSQRLAAALSSRGTPPSQVIPSPELIIGRSHGQRPPSAPDGAIAVETVLDPAVNWTDRLALYEDLGFGHLVVITDDPHTRTILELPGAFGTRVLLTVRAPQFSATPISDKPQWTTPGIKPRGSDGVRPPS